MRRARAGSVAAVRSLSQIALSASRRLMVLPRLFDIFAWPSRPRILGVVENSGCGSANVSPKRALQRRTISRASSRCWRWSSPTGHARRAVEQDVGGLQHRVGEQPGVDVVGVVLGLVLELRHAAELAERRHRRQRPGQLGVLGHGRLHEQRRAVGIDAAGQHVDRHLAHPPRHLGRLVGLRDGVVVDDAIEAAVLVLQLDPGADGAQVVAEVQLARGLDPEKTVSIVSRCLVVSAVTVK